MKIICIGRNYAKHAAELGNKVPTEPVFFLKPDSAQLHKRNPLYYPEFTNDLHYEVELLLRISRLGKHIEERFAHKYYDAIGLGIDFTARDVQMECKAKGLPWEKAKAFDGSAVVGREFLPLEGFKDLQNIDFSLKKNGEVVQAGNSKDMIFSFDQIVSHLSKFFTLKKGDLIYTGTPEGVGPVSIGDTLQGYIGEQELLKVNIR